MIPLITAVRMGGTRGRTDLPFLVLGPSLGTSTDALWSECAGLLSHDFDVLGWDFPGNGPHRAMPQEPFTVAELSAGVLRAVDDVLTERDDSGGRFFYAGASISGEVGRQLLHDAPRRVMDAALLGPELAPDEAPGNVAELLREQFRGQHPGRHPDRHRSEPQSELTVREVRDAGMVVRREVLGDTHVDRATAGATDFTQDFQELITEYAWGSIWTRPGLDRRSRSLITLTALIARGHHEELAMHVRAARTNGLTVGEIKELILQTAIYCGVPDANTAFRIAQQALQSDEP